MKVRNHLSLWWTASAVVAVALGATLEASLSAQDDVVPPPGPAVALSDTCALCHSASDNAAAMRDSGNRSVAPYDLWSGTMMANSARDPFWRAVVSAEIAAAPHAAEAIAAKCLRCHTPMADELGLDDHDTADVLHALTCEGELGDFARDGVSCTICHGMSPEGLGTEASFTAGFTLDPYQRIFGPHEEPFTGPMRMHVGLTPAYGEHMTSSALCGSCHTLITHPFDGEGKPTDIGFHEQAPFLEWRNSVFAGAADGTGETTCQACHLPRTDSDGESIKTPLAHNPGGFDFPFLESREPFGRHLLVGGNAFVLSLLRDNAELLGATATKAAFDATIAATRHQLSTRTAGLSISAGWSEDERLQFDVTVTNRTGHKLPSGHPSRRMWIEVVVEDADGTEVFVSGRSDRQGRIVGPAGDPLATELRGGPVEPHRSLIRSPDETPRYRAVMATTDGDATHTLMRGATWLIDDRILPRGWRTDHADAEATRAYGTGADSDFAPDGASEGSDTVRYDLELSGRAPHLVRARLLYQTASPRWVDEIAAYDTPAVRRFLDMASRNGNVPEVLAEARRRIGGPR